MEKNIKGMYVIKRNGNRQAIHFDKITCRLSRLCEMKPKLTIDPVLVSQKVIQGIYPGVKTQELDDLAAETSAYMSTIHPEFADLASRIAISNLHKGTLNDFCKTMELERNHINPRNNQASPLLAQDVWEIIKANEKELNEAIVYERDYNYDYFGFKTLERSYLCKLNNIIVERPQHLLMRVAIGIHKSDIKSAIETYNGMSNMCFIHATPTLFNAGTPHPQMSSCFLLEMKEDSIEGIYETLKRCALISKSAGGIGLSVSTIRASQSYIRGTNGQSNGLVPMLRVYNDTARYVDQCFPGNTMIYTHEGLKPIDTIQIGDKVLTHKNCYQNVLKIIKHEPNAEQIIYEISLPHLLDPIEVTDKHPFFAISMEGKTPDTFLTACRLSAGYAHPKWIETCNLMVNDFLCFPIDSNDKDIDWSNEDCFFYGLLCRIGITYNNGVYSVTLDDQELIPSLMNYVISTGIQFTYSHSPKPKFEFVIPVHFWEFIGQNESPSEIYLFPSFFRLPLSKTLHLLKGIAHIDQNTGNIIVKNTLKITKNLSYMLSRKGILCSFITQDEQSSVLMIPKTQEILSLFNIDEKEGEEEELEFFTHENYTYIPISHISIKENKNQHILYDLEVQTDHSYVTTCGIVHNGGGKRKGAFAMYVEPWHADIFEFLDLKKNSGKEEQRARDLFYGLWISDLFMKRVEKDEDWSLFCPNEAPGLVDTWGDKFEALYISYEAIPGLARKICKAQQLWFKILESQIETGTPYMLYKDTINAKSNQQNLGTIKSSNLCTEVVQYTSPNEVAVCNLASVALPLFVCDKKFDHDGLFKIIKLIVRNLNKVIDNNHYPIEEAKYSNLRHRPMGIGVQGLADVFILMGLSWDSPGAAALNRDIFETIYYAALTSSKDLAKIYGPYDSYQGSPVSRNILQFDMWNVKPSDRWDWDSLRQEIALYGVRNSLLIAPMPTASTSQILGNNEAIEPYLSNIYTRKVLAGEFTVINKHLVNDLISRGLWNVDIKNRIIGHKGSVQLIPEIPNHLKLLYKTAWEIPARTLINMAADRGAFIDQSQSFNIFMEKPTDPKLTSMHFYGWKKGLKTGMYYLRSRPAADAIQVTIDQTSLNIKSIKEEKKEEEKSIPGQVEESEVCRREPGCDSCGS